MPVGCRLPRHTDSAEETIVLIGGRAGVSVQGEESDLSGGAIALIPANTPHEVRNLGGAPLRFLAAYAGTDVVTTYEAEAQPDGSRQRRPLG